MKRKAIASIIVLSLVAASNANLVCVYDFDQTLAPKINNSGAADLKFVQGTGAVNDAGTPTYSVQTVGSVSKYVAEFAMTQGFKVQSGMTANAGGTKVNRYTLIWDLKVTSMAPGYFSFYQTNPSNTDDGDMFYKANTGLGISGDYKNSNPPYALDNWHRIAMSVDLTGNRMTIYVDGNLANDKTDLYSGVDGRWSLEPNSSANPFFLIFMDEDGENAAGYISQFAIFDSYLTQSQIQALGTVGQPVPEPATLAVLGLGALGLLARRKSRNA